MHPFHKLCGYLTNKSDFFLWLPPIAWKSSLIWLVGYVWTWDVSVVLLKFGEPAFLPLGVKRVRERILLEMSRSKETSSNEISQLCRCLSLQFWQVCCDPGNIPLWAGMYVPFFCYLFKWFPGDKGLYFLYYLSFLYLLSKTPYWKHHS